MTLDPTWLMLSLIPSGIGFVLFTYGRKQQRWPHTGSRACSSWCIPTSRSTVMSLVAVGGTLGFLLWYAVHLGW